MSEKELNQRFSKIVKLRMAAETFGLKAEELTKSFGFCAIQKIFK